MTKYLLLLRGLPGSGKSTLAKVLAEENSHPIYAIDDYFTDKNGLYQFDYKQNHLAYAHCQKRTEQAMQQALKKIIVENTFVFDWEIEPYFALAKKYEYTVFSIVVEKHHQQKNIHQIADSDIEKMAAKFKVKLL